MKGYGHPIYANSFAEFGTPLQLSNCGGWILKRRIPGRPNYDGMGCYPLFSCQDWSQLASDLDALSEQLVTLTIVADPFGRHDVELLRRCFPELVIPFKEHLVVDLASNFNAAISKNHRRNARRALQKICVEVSSDPNRLLDDWCTLYSHLIDRHRIRGISAFSRLVFEHQFRVPGLVAFRAESGAATVGMLLWYVQGNVGYYHLGACNPAGYEVKAFFGLFSTAIEYFAANGLHWLNLGAGPGTKDETQAGLKRFKEGWANDKRTAYFCGRIFDHAKYQEMSGAFSSLSMDYFPAYRQGEFS